MKAKVTRSACALALITAGFAGGAAAQDPAVARGLAATCTACHGTDGRSVGGVPPSLAGRDRGELLQTMKDFRAGKRPATIMHQHAMGYTDAQLELIAGYFAGVKSGAAAPAPAARGSN